jgi:hypothetical protein
MIRKYIRWTKELCREEASKYLTRKEFKLNCGWGYEVARVNGWLNEICPLKNVRRIWTKEKCHAEALKYNCRGDFKRGSSNAYDKSIINGWIDEITSHMIIMGWTKEKCQTEALKYDTRINFYNGNQKAFMAAYKHGWLKEICVHMKRLGNRYFRCVYAYEFPDNSVYVGLTYNLHQRNLNRQSDNRDSVTKYISETNLKPILKQITDYISADEASQLEIQNILQYKNNGWNILNKAKGGNTGGGDRKWTKELCHNEALKYGRRSEFYYESNNAYSAAIRYGWLNEICSHMNKKWMNYQKID